MKTYIILVSLVMAVSAAEWKLKTEEEYVAMVVDCDRRFSPDFEQQITAKKLKGIPIEAIPGILCRMKGSDVWSDSKGFIVDRIMFAFDLQNKDQKVDREKFRNFVESCQDKNSQGSSPTEFAHRILNCFFVNEEFGNVLNDIRMYTRNEDKH